MKSIYFLIAVVVVFLSCYGSDEGVVEIKLRLSLQNGGSGDIDSGKRDSQMSIDNYFAIGVLNVTDSNGTTPYQLSIDYESARQGIYYFEQTINAKIGERLGISFAGYYYKDDSTVGGFTSAGESELVVSESMNGEVMLPSIDLPICEATVIVKDGSIDKINFYDSAKNLYLKTIKKSDLSNNFYIKLPEGTYDIYGFNPEGTSKLLKGQVKVSGSTQQIDL